MQRLGSSTSSVRKSEIEDIVSLKKETARISELLDSKLSEHETCVQLQLKLEKSEESLREQNQKLFAVQNDFQSYKDEMFKEIEDVKTKLLQEQLKSASLEKHCDNLTFEKSVRVMSFLYTTVGNGSVFFILKHCIFTENILILIEIK